MGLFDSLHRSVEALREAPGVRALRRLAYERRFRAARAAHLFHGVHDSFEAAARSAPPTAPIGYDDPASTDLYVGHVRPDVHDYPAFFWLRDAFASGARRLVDLGGNVGIKYHAYTSLSPLPAGCEWRVVDVPAVAARGRELQAGRPSGESLVFDTDPARLSGTDVLFTSGTLQYLPETLAELLSRADGRPARIVVNTTALHDTRSFYTLNNIGTAYCPYRVQGREAFVASLEALGYRVRDRWLNVGKALRIPFTEGCDVEAYSGFCFELESASGTTRR